MDEAPDRPDNPEGLGQPAVRADLHRLRGEVTGLLGSIQTQLREMERSMSQRLLETERRVQRLEDTAVISPVEVGEQKAVQRVLVNETQEMDKRLTQLDEKLDIQVERLNDKLGRVQRTIALATGGVAVVVAAMPWVFRAITGV